MRAREFLLEAAYDAKIASVEKQFGTKYPNRVSDIRWAKRLGRMDRVLFYLQHLVIVIKSIDKISSDEKTQKDFSYESALEHVIKTLQTQLEHYMGMEYIPGIANYRFDVNRSPNSTFHELENIVKEWQAKQTQESPIYPRTGDRKIFDYGNTAWWLLDRGYCDEEGRSGDHCGNVAGRGARDQRILSFRKKDNKDPNGWHVILTFILHLDGIQISGSLGEMKAKSNNKPAPNQHKPILDLLMSDIVTGIKSGGYAPENNFSVFDFDEPTLKMIDEKKPVLISEQIETGDDGSKIHELPDWIKIKYKDTIQETYGSLIYYAEPVILEKIFNAIGEYVRDYMYEYASDMESQDDGWQEYQATEAIERGYYTSELSQEELEELSPRELLGVVEIDWDEVNEDGELNDYLQYNDDLRRDIDSINEVQKTNGSAIKQYTKDLEEDDGDDYGTTEIKKLDRVYSFIITTENNKRDYFIQHMAEWIEKKVGVYDNTLKGNRNVIQETQVEHDGVVWYVVLLK